MSSGSQNHPEPVRNRWPTSSSNRFPEVVYIDHRNRCRRSSRRKINKTKGEFIMTTTPDDLEEMTEKQASEEGLFDSPTCGRLRETSELTPQEADDLAALRGVKIVRT
jgi:hypothetical protein